MTLPDGATRLTLPSGADLILPEEVPVALVFDGVTQAVMMATPADIADFHLGFALTEGLVTSPTDISGTEVIAQPRGIEARGWLAPELGARFVQRRRAMAGPVGCGLCGIDSLEQALRVLPPRDGNSIDVTAEDGTRALNDLREGQALKDVSRGTHAAAFWVPGQGVVLLREDVGRHNALDKLAGALARAGIDPVTGAVVMTSRVSVDLVQKAAVIGAGALIAPSVPTALAVAEAATAGLRLIARAGRTLAVFSEGRV